MTTFFIGDLAIDEYFTADRWPGRADKGFVHELPSEAGGSIANAAVVHAALAAGSDTLPATPPEFISLLNESALSDRLIADLEANGVSTRHMLRDAGIPESRNLIFLVDGEHIVLTVEMGQQPMWLRAETLAALRKPGLLYTTLYRARRLHAETRDGVLARADLLADLRHHGRLAIFDLDVGGAGLDDLPFLQGAAAVLMNEIGFRHSFGHDDLGQAQDWMQENGVQRLVRTMAEDGAEALEMLADGSLRRHHVAGYRVSVADVTGAGDTFGGALTLGIAEGRAFGEVLEFAVAAASHSVTRHGPRGGKATRAETEAWISVQNRAH